MTSTVYELFLCNLDLEQHKGNDIIYIFGLTITLTLIKTH